MLDTTQIYVGYSFLGDQIESMVEYLSEYKKIVENTVQKIAKIEKLIINK